MSSVDIYSILSSKPHNSHYLNRYWKFIQSFNHQKRIKGKTELHHICPKSADLFPEYKSLKIHSWNGIHLTHRQHFIAHWLLAKSYSGKQAFAFWTMANKTASKYEKPYHVSSIAYAVSRELFVSVSMSEEVNQKRRKPHKNPRKPGYKTVPCSEEKKLKISIANTGSKRTLDQRQKISDAGKGRIPWNKGLTYSTGKPSPLKGKKQRNHNPNSNPLGPHPLFFTLIETRQHYTKRNLSRYFPEFKQYY